MEFPTSKGPLLFLSCASLAPRTASRRRHSRRRRPPARDHEVRASLPAGDRGDAPERLGPGASARARRPLGRAIHTRLRANRGTRGFPADAPRARVVAGVFLHARGGRRARLLRERAGFPRPAASTRRNPLRAPRGPAFMRLQTPLLLFASTHPAPPFLSTQFLCYKTLKKCLKSIPEAFDKAVEDPSPRSSPAAHRRAARLRQDAQRRAPEVQPLLHQLGGGLRHEGDQTRGGVPPRGQRRRLTRPRVHPRAPSSRLPRLRRFPRRARPHGALGLPQLHRARQDPQEARQASTLSLRSPFLVSVLQQPFYSTEVLSQLITKTEARFRKLNAVEMTDAERRESAAADASVAEVRGWTPDAEADAGKPRAEKTETETTDARRRIGAATPGRARAEPPPRATPMMMMMMRRRRRARRSARGRRFWRISSARRRRLLWRERAPPSRAGTT